MPDAYRHDGPEIPCDRHPVVAAQTSCTACGSLLCDGCRVFVRGTQTCVSCRATSRLSAGAFLWTFAAVAGLLCLFAAVTKRSLAEMTSPSPVTSTLASPAMAFMFILGPTPLSADVPRCLGDTCFYPIRMLD